MALAGTMATVARDIPKSSARDSFAAVAAGGAPTAAFRAAHALPTPPNSISPNLPPHGLKARDALATNPPALEAVDSDVDLQDSAPGSLPSLSGFETAGAITPTLLAKHHLPEILLSHGPLAIRHIMGYLTTSVPGFSGIPPAKARRLVVGALEGRGSNGEGGGVDGDVQFEKVGWGRWDARMKGQSARSKHSPPPSGPSSYSAGMPIATGKARYDGRTRLGGGNFSWTGHSGVFSHDEDIDVTMTEDLADKMSLDGSCSSSEAPEEDEIMDDDPNDITDDEDWAAVGAAALRQTCYSASGPGHNLLSSHVYTGGAHSGGGLSLMARSVPRMQQHRAEHNIDFSAFGADLQEREAVEALLRMGSI